MTTKLQKWGNSLGVRLPKTEIKKAGLREGKSVSVRAFKGGIFIKSVPVKKMTLSELVSKINPRNKHEEIDWGVLKGSEIW